MAQKVIAFGTVGPAADQIAWKGILDDDTLGGGDSTNFHLECTRTAGSPAFVGGAPGLHVAIIKLPPFPPPQPVSIDPGPADWVGLDGGNQFGLNETKSISFHITNAPAPLGVTPATYTLICIIHWNATGVLADWRGPFIGVLVAP